MKQRGRRCKSKHRKCWIIGWNPGWLWCYECGAIRPNVEAGEARWVYPVGPDAENPAVTRMKKLHPATRPLLEVVQ